MKEDVGTCCDGKPPHEMCKTCREEYETWKQAKGSDKDYSSVKKKKLKKWEESPYTKEAIKEHQKKMRAMNRIKSTKEINMSNKSQPNKATETSTEDVWPRGASWQSNTLTKSTVESFIRKAKTAMQNKDIRDALEALIKEENKDDPNSNKMMATPAQIQRAKAERPFENPTTRALSPEERDSMFRAKYKLPPKEQVEREAKEKQQKKEAQKIAAIGSGYGARSGYVPIDTLSEKSPGQVEYEKDLIRQHEDRAREDKKRLEIARSRPPVVIRRGAAGNDAAIPQYKPNEMQDSSQAQTAPQPQKPAELNDEEKSRLEELMNNIALAHQQKQRR